MSEAMRWIARLSQFLKWDGMRRRDVVVSFNGNRSRDWAFDGVLNDFSTSDERGKGNGEGKVLLPSSSSSSHTLRCVCDPTTKVSFAPKTRIGLGRFPTWIACLFCCFFSEDVYPVGNGKGNWDRNMGFWEWKWEWEWMKHLPINYQTTVLSGRFR